MHGKTEITVPWGIKINDTETVFDCYITGYLKNKYISTHGKYSNYRKIGIICILKLYTQCSLVIIHYCIIRSRLPLKCVVFFIFFFFRMLAYIFSLKWQLTWQLGWEQGIGSKYITEHLLAINLFVPWKNRCWRDEANWSVVESNSNVTDRLPVTLGHVSINWAKAASGFSAARHRWVSRKGKPSKKTKGVPYQDTWGRTSSRLQVIKWELSANKEKHFPRIMHDQASN